MATTFWICESWQSKALKSSARADQSSKLPSNSLKNSVLEFPFATGINVDVVESKEAGLRIDDVHIIWNYVHQEYTNCSEQAMATTTKRTHKHFQLDANKIKRVQRALQAKTETEAIERALELVIVEHEKNRLVADATDRFVKSGIEIKDVYGTLGV
ncbi:MAG: hypothetical protein JO065_00535 [Acidobacteria bacterium]|nr:hypothetical protein [Acidobacteriota bacterium]